MYEGHVLVVEVGPGVVAAAAAVQVDLVLIVY